jgi:hypothetical protein
VIFDDMAKRLLLLTCKCQSVPFAAFAKKKVPSPHGLMVQNIELSAKLTLHIYRTQILALLQLVSQGRNRLTVGTVFPGVVSSELTLALM